MKLEQLKLMVEVLELNGATSDTDIFLYANAEAERCNRSPDRPAFINMDIETEFFLRPREHRVGSGSKEGTYFLPMKVSVKEHYDHENWLSAGT